MLIDSASREHVLRYFRDMMRAMAAAKDGAMETTQIFEERLQASS